MNFWWIAFWVIEAVLVGVIVVPKFLPKHPSSVDVDMGEEIGNLFVGGVAVLLAVIAFTIFAWNHFRFSP